MQALALRNVTKVFRESDAVRDLSFEVGRGCVFGLLGPNGAGKTTTIRMIVDILAPDSGEILASKVYRAGILIYGKRLTLSEVRRWLRYG